jgi:hypothetical protein
MDIDSHPSLRHKPTHSHTQTQAGEEGLHGPGRVQKAGRMQAKTYQQQPFFPSLLAFLPLPTPALFSRWPVQDYGAGATLHS